MSTEPATGERGVRRSRMSFVVMVEGEERVFLSLREARLAAEESGSGVEARRTSV